MQTDRAVHGASQPLRPRASPALGHGPGQAAQLRCLTLLDIDLACEVQYGAISSSTVISPYSGHKIWLHEAKGFVTRFVGMVRRAMPCYACCTRTQGSIV